MLQLGYSGSDMTNLVNDAFMGKVRESVRVGIRITELRAEDRRPETSYSTGTCIILSIDFEINTGFKIL